VTPPSLHLGEAKSITLVSHESWNKQLKDLWFKKKTGRPKKEKIKKNCLCCNKEILVVKSKENRTKFCSEICSRLYRRKVERPSKEQLVIDIRSLSWLSIGRKYGVSDRTIKKWAISYDIDTSVRSYAGYIG
jgi:hypothetical protein